MPVKPMTKATLKDIEYALEYGGERLLKTIDHERHKIQWTFQKSGRPVDGVAANRFMQNKNCMAVEDGLFPGNSQTFCWKP